MGCHMGEEEILAQRPGAAGERQPPLPHPPSLLSSATTAHRRVALLSKTHFSLNNPETMNSVAQRKPDPLPLRSSHHFLIPADQSGRWSGAVSTSTVGDG